MATGWLGWSPDTAWNTPIPQILLALDGRIDWHKKTNPLGAPEEKPKPESKLSVSDRMRAMFRARGTRKVNGRLS